MRAVCGDTAAPAALRGRRMSRRHSELPRAKGHIRAQSRLSAH